MERERESRRGGTCGVGQNVEQVCSGPWSTSTLLITLLMGWRHLLHPSLLCPSPPFHLSLKNRERGNKSIARLQMKEGTRGTFERKKKTGEEKMSGGEGRVLLSQAG